MIAGTSVAGVESCETAGSAMCALITAAAPAAIAARKGRSSIWSMRWRDAETIGRALCESVSVSPWPGKCLIVAATPVSCTPRTNAALKRATAFGSSPNDRTLITGLAGLLFTSTAGANATWIPIARDSSPMMRPAACACAALPVAPIAMLLGSTVASPPRSSPGVNVPPSRRPRPGSTSEATRSGMRDRRCSAFTLAATSIGDPSDITTPPTWSSAIRSAVQANEESVVLV